MHTFGSHPTKLRFATDRFYLRRVAVARSIAFATLSVLLGCSNQSDALKAELFPETQQPYFKTCAARLGGTYKERELQRHFVVDIYKEPAPDEGPMTDECISRE
mgnify:CR=1 FL=1